MDNMELDVKRRGVFSTIFSAFKEGLGGLINSEPIEEEEETKNNPTIKEYVKANKDNPNIEDLLKPIKAEEMLKERKGKHNKIVEEVEIKSTTKEQNVKNAIVQEVIEVEKDQTEEQEK